MAGCRAMLCCWAVPRRLVGARERFVFPAQVAPPSRPVQGVQSNRAGCPGNARARGTRRAGVASLDELGGAGDDRDVAKIRGTCPVGVVTARRARAGGNDGARTHGPEGERGGWYDARAGGGPWVQTST